MEYKPPPYAVYKPLLNYLPKGNPFLGDTTENKIYLDLINLTQQCIEKIDKLHCREILKNDYELAKLPTDQAFIKRLIDKFKFNFSVSKLEF